MDAIWKATVTAFGASARMAAGIDWEAATKAADENPGKIIFVMDLLETTRSLSMYYKIIFWDLAGRGGLRDYEKCDGNPKIKSKIKSQIRSAQSYNLIWKEDEMYASCLHSSLPSNRHLCSQVVDATSQLTRQTLLLPNRSANPYYSCHKKNYAELHTQRIHNQQKK